MSPAEIVLCSPVAAFNVQAPEAIGNAYLRLASSAARDGRFANAVSLTGRARDMAPTLAEITPASERYSRYQAIEQTLKSAATSPVVLVRHTVTAVELARYNHTAVGL